MSFVLISWFQWGGEGREREPSNDPLALRNNKRTYIFATPLLSLGAEAKNYKQWTALQF